MSAIEKIGTVLRVAGTETLHARRRGFGGRQIAALGLVAALSAVLVGVFLWMVQPAAANEAEAACRGMRGNPQNPALGAINPDAGRQAPDFTVTSWDGKPVKLSSFRGKVVLVHMWASWCSACEAEKPALIKMARDMVGDDFQVVSLASDVDWGSVQKALPHGAPFQVFLDKPAEEGTIGPLTTSWGTHAVPESFLIDRRGRIRYYFDNRRQWDSSVAETCIDSLIDEQ
jgi:peroxiredoxin